MNFNLVNNLYVFKLLLLDQNNPTAVWLILLDMRYNKSDICKENKKELSVFANEFFVFFFYNFYIFYF